ncbi:hypothetical protein SAMN05192574_11056 [Mucilaginibacter gossypiicola]|uniref:Uncharacterized protein n=1 Tax=Mucilaginibacter gossypiicola TaxID=551995 RepID=A0A1H8RAC7_9SPHI|nr:hypothetical protein [Mucilaginibacter gossypiicola]SEO63322.1 hypothetical protein SAMN05192574_11056 [Mucilaginibacter gossypiicola]
MTRFWFKFGFNNSEVIPYGTRLGCGITAYNYEDAVAILTEKVFRNNPLADIAQCIENVDISTLDEGHVLSNMDQPNVRGVWFPLGYQ